MITYDNLRSYAYSNDTLLEGDARGIVIDFMGLGFSTMFPKETHEGVFYAGKNLIYIIPYLNPWAWLNKTAVSKDERDNKSGG